MGKDEDEVWDRVCKSLTRSPSYHSNKEDKSLRWKRMLEKFKILALYKVIDEEEGHEGKWYVYTGIEHRNRKGLHPDKCIVRLVPGKKDDPGFTCTCEPGCYRCVHIDAVRDAWFISEDDEPPLTWDQLEDGYGLD